VRLAGLQIPLNEMGAFDLLAWQFLWAGGLWIGAGRPENIFKVLTSKIGVIVALLVAAVFFLLRHPFLNLQFGGEIWSGLTDKWHLGALRLLDFSSFVILFAVSRPWLARWLTISPLLLLGKASLEVFCAHLLFCFAALSFVNEGTRLPPSMQDAFVGSTMTGLYIVARLFVNARAGAPRNKACSPHSAVLQTFLWVSEQSRRMGRRGVPLPCARHMLSKHVFPAASISSSLGMQAQVPFNTHGISFAHTEQVFTPRDGGALTIC
jgi:hypothetical protein